MSAPILFPKLNRRTLLHATAVAATNSTWHIQRASAADNPPNSVIHGVSVGCITYSYRGGPDTAEYTLECVLKDGISEIELMDGPISSYTGIVFRRGRRGRTPDSPEPAFDADRPKVREEQLAKCVQLRKLFNDAGVNIHIHKCPFGQSDDEIEFNFQIAKALGCKAITTERNDDLAKRLAPFADKHRIWVAFHNHTSNIPTLDNIDPLMQIGDFIGFNFDIGHYVAGTKGQSPIPVLEKYHEKIISLHLKDRTTDGGNLPWGQGQTPIKEVLQLLKNKRWPIYADIELEYRVPSESDAVSEVAKCLEFCKAALV
ncbi:MAG: sugar phosphate isomerase/epimerase [Planctomycetales bacterium]|nr:sugar phosphate isomerase/epimerase [Planctomycetales bacterium]